MRGLGARLTVQAQMPLIHQILRQLARFEKTRCEQPFIKAQFWWRGRRVCAS
jgi:hypothetical protein